MNWNLKQLGQLFQVLMLYLQKSPHPPPWKKFSFNALWWTLFETLFTIIQQHFSYRGYYTVPQRYEFYFREAKTIFYSLAHEFYFRVAKRAQRVSKTLFLPRENKIHIFKPPCSVLLLCRQNNIDKTIEGNYQNYVIDKLTCEIMGNKPLGSRM